MPCVFALEQCDNVGDYRLYPYIHYGILEFCSEEGEWRRVCAGWMESVSVNNTHAHIRQLLVEQLQQVIVTADMNECEPEGDETQCTYGQCFNTEERYVCECHPGFHHPDGDPTKCEGV